MAATWPGSRIPYIDENGDPMVGAKLYFYDEGTTTPQVVYSDASLSTPIDQPVLANSRGMFQVIFLNPTPGSYRVKLLESDDTLIFDDDGISVPQVADYVPPTAGDTDPTLLFSTGDMKPRYATGAHSGWVRANGRTIGSASSGASERANADCEDLFLHLWTEDSTLSVSTGRGGSAAGDWAANKTIVLPDLRDRVLAGMGDMGNTDAGLITDSFVDGSESTSILGATAGAGSVALSIAQLPSHNHGGATTNAQLHGHSTFMSEQGGGDGNGSGGLMMNNSDFSSETAFTGTPNGTSGQQIGGGGAHEHTIASQGSGSAHTNVQPTLFATIYIKL